jgi:uncharacterized spore protein YtfJ
MQNPIDELLPRITDFLRDEAKTETVIGEVFKLGEFSCVPVVRIGFGFGGALGEGDQMKKAHGEGGGGGAGLGIEPIGFLVSRADEITFLPTRPKSGLSTAFEQLPELMDKFVEMRKEERMAEPV